MGSFCTNNNSQQNSNYNFDNSNINNANNNKGNLNMNNSLNTTNLNNNSFLKYNNLNNSNNYNINNFLNIPEKKNITDKNITIINSIVKGYLFRKKYKEYLKTDLMDFTNELYFNFIQRIKNKKVSKILSNDNTTNKKIIEYRRIDWNEFYKDDPNKIINLEISNMKTYVNGIIFEYPEKNFHSDKIEICIKNALSCYKGSININTLQKCGLGELIYSDGSQKIGTFYNNDFIGWNTYITSDGILYVGLFQDNKLTGKGLKYNLNKDSLYKGDFIDFKRNGNGIYIRESSKYEGQFVCDKKHGHGKLEFKTGDVYIGEFKNNSISGYGKYIWQNGKHEYNGNFLNGKFHGEGLYKWEDNQYFKGTYNNGVKEGKGEIGYDNGKKCFINFKNGKPDGKGILYDENRNEIEIEFEKGIFKNPQNFNNFNIKIN